MELRVFGPPGTGKTTHLAQRIAAAVDRFGSAAVLVSSFTRAAAREIASRKIPVDHENVGTLHSIMYRALGAPKLTADHLADWNKAFPHYELSDGAAGDVDEASFDRAVGLTIGDRCMSIVDQQRARMVPREAWPDDVRHFADRWEEWKQGEGLLDFTDLIEIGLRDFNHAPNAPRVGFFDEAQDFSRLQTSLIRKWAAQMDYVLFAGDDDQMLYDFAGATPDAFLEPPIPDAQRTVLAQSWRVPSRVHALAERWVRQLQRREPKEYRPREFPGEVRRIGATMSLPHLIGREIDRTLADGKTVMVLASCAYMLGGAIRWLRSEGVPFWNPYRKTRGDWNPLAHRKGSVSTFDRLQAYLQPTCGFPPVWSCEELSRWVAPLQSKGLLKRGAKDLLDVYAEEKRSVPKDLGEYLSFLSTFFEDDGMSDLMNALDNGPSLPWYMRHLLASKARAFEFPARVIERGGIDLGRKTPQVIVGTIHSVKGGEADDVVLFPDLSMAGVREWIGAGSGHDGVVRQFYVGMTRCRERLLIGAPGSSYFVPIVG